MLWGVRTVVEASAVPITTVQAFEHLNLEPGEDAVNVADALSAAIAHVEKETSRPLCLATFELVGDGFEPMIRFPIAPVAEVLAIDIVDAAGTERTLDPSDWRLTLGPPARLTPAIGKSWPATARVPEAVRVRFTAGYDVSRPADLDHAVKVALGIFYRDREGATGDAEWKTVSRLCRRHVVMPA